MASAIAFRGTPGHFAGMEGEESGGKICIVVSARPACNAMPLWAAEIPEIVRAERKDAAVVAQLSARLSALLRDLAPPSLIPRLSPHLPSLASGLYYSATTLQACNAMPLWAAEIPEIVRAERKDAAVVAQLSARLSALLRDLAPPSLIPRLSPHLPSLASGLYYSATTLQACNAMPLWAAEIPEIVRAERKDAAVVAQLSVRLSALLRDLAPPSLIPRLSPHLPSLASGLYYSATTLQACNAMPLWAAEIPEIVRAERKDAAVVAQLSARLSALLRDLAPPSLIPRLSPHLPSLASGLYYSATTLQACNAMPLWAAEIPEIVRAERKDAAVVAQLSARLSALLRDLAPPSLIPRLSPHLPSLASGLYYSATTLQGLQTCGEEYLGLVEAVGDPPGLGVPSLPQRLAFVFLNSAAGPLVSLAYTHLKRQGESGRRHWVVSELEGVFREQPGLLGRLSQGLFYLTGLYYLTARRLLAIRAYSYRPDTVVSPTFAYLFRLVGALSLLQIVVSVSLLVVHRRPEGSELGVRLGSGAERGWWSSDEFKCVLCLESGQPAAATPCGHVFCWSCIHTQSVAMIRLLSPAFRPCSTQATNFPTVYMSGIQPTGVLHLGNYFGAVERWVRLQTETKAPMFVMVADLHSLTTGIPAKGLNASVTELTASLLACGINPQRVVLFRQSAVPEHLKLAWIFHAFCSVQKLSRLTQYKDKAAAMGPHASVPAGLLVYPIVQAADILLYKATHVPVVRDIVTGANVVIGGGKAVFPTPVVVSSPVPRLRSLRSLAKMSKSDKDPKSRLLISDDPSTIRLKLRKAVTDCIGRVEYAPESRPAVSNLVHLHSVVSGNSIYTIVQAAHSIQTGEYKGVVAEAVVELVEPIRKEYVRLMEDKDFLFRTLEDGEKKAREKAEETMTEVLNLLN